MSQTEMPQDKTSSNDNGKPREVQATVHKAKHAGFIAGVFSGITKLTVGHPFDTIKVRMQTSPEGMFRGPMDCVWQTLKKEGVRGFYKGATPPLVGWMVMDSIMLGSLQVYKRYIHQTFYAKEKTMPLPGSLVSGVLAGWTVSFVAAPIEHVKARLQVQYDAKTKVYTGPINCAYKLVKEAGFFRGLYRGLFSTMVFRTNFLFWWGSYDIFTRWFQTHTSMTGPAINFWSGGLSATVFWIAAYPSDVIKQTIMTDSVLNPKYKTWWSAAKGVYQLHGWKGYLRGFGPTMLRSFPANAAALTAFEAVMKFF